MRVSQVILWYIVIPALCICVGIGIASWIYIFKWDGDFRDEQVEEFLQFRPSLLAEVLDSDGNYLVELPGVDSGGKIFRYGRWVHYEAIPDAMVYAALSAEDKRFFFHNGIDGNAIVRAISVIARESIKSMDVIFAEGASTITQQTVRLIFLGDLLGREQNGNASKKEKLFRKIKEIRMALWLERRLAERLGSKKRAKQKIFEVFANVSYCGEGRYGFEEGSRFYFNTALAVISVDQAALLAGIMRNPSYYSPRMRVISAKIRRNQVLRSMRDNGFIKAHDAERLMSLPVITAEIQKEKTIAPSVVGYVVKEIWGHGKKIVWENGAAVHTNIKRSWQVAANKALEHGLEAYITRHPEYKNKVQGAIVVLSNDGKIRAIVGGVRVTYSSFNRATEARRQPGSAFKPFVYITAFEQGWRLSSVWDGDGLFEVNDSPVTIPMGRGKQPHLIQNYDGRFLGKIELWQALAESRNAATIRLAIAVTPEAIVGVARRLGLNMNIEAYPTTAIGAEEVTPLELAGAYLVFANGGTYMTPKIVESITYADGVRSVFPDSERKKVLYENTAIQIMAGLRHTVLWQSGTGRKLRMLPFAVAGKTGTSNDFRDAWFCGFTYGNEGMTACVWVGIDDGTPLGDGEQCVPRDPVRSEFCEPGGRVALPIFGELVAEIYKNQYPKPFPSVVEKMVAEAHRHAVVPEIKKAP